MSWACLGLAQAVAPPLCPHGLSPQQYTQNLRISLLAGCLQRGLCCLWAVGGPPPKLQMNGPSIWQWRLTSFNRLTVIAKSCDPLLGCNVNGENAFLRQIEAGSLGWKKRANLLLVYDFPFLWRDSRLCCYRNHLHFTVGSHKKRANKRKSLQLQNSFEVHFDLFWTLISFFQYLSFFHPKEPRTHQNHQAETSHRAFQGEQRKKSPALAAGVHVIEAVLFQELLQQPLVLSLGEPSSGVPKSDLILVGPSLTNFRFDIYIYIYILY
jgi:hypothetical protein